MNFIQARFHTAWVKMSRATHLVGTADLPQ
jgi:hypothetical protein